MGQQIHWFPGHMNKALNEVENKVKLVDVIIELFDARAPLSSINENLEKLTANKKKLIVLTKIDLADPEHNKKWVAELSKKYDSVISLDLKKNNAEIILSKAVVELGKEKHAKEIARGMKPQPVRAMIIGIPNVGKSSLLNAFLGEDRAIVTDIAGTTRDVIEGHANIDGIVLHLFDTAGIRESDDVIESIGVERSIKTIKEADIVVVVLDSSSNLDDEDKKILEFVKKYNPIIVYNKSDSIKQNNKDVLAVSAINNEIQPLVDAIKNRLGLDEQVFSKPALKNARQLGLLAKAKESLETAKNDALNDLTVDLISTSLFDAYTSILEILGEANQIDLAKEIFARFCVGK